MSAPGPWLVNSYPFELACRELEARGLDPSPVLQRHGVDRSTFHAVAGKLPLYESLPLSAALVELAGDPELGLHAGLRADLADYGAFGVMLRSSPDFLVAIAQFSRHNQHGPDRVFNLDVVIEGERIKIRYLEGGDHGMPRFQHDAFAGILHALAPHLITEPVDAIELAYPEPADRSSYDRLLGCPVRFGMPVSQLVVSVAKASRAFPHADPLVNRTVEQLVPDSIRILGPVDLISRVRAALAGDAGAPPPTMTEVAEKLSTTERTLRRHLHAAGTSFQELLDETRQQMTLQHFVHNPAATGAEIAGRLGYTDPPAFYRAFKRWTGQSLTEYREQRLLDRQN